MIFAISTLFFATTIFAKPPKIGDCDGLEPIESDFLNVGEFCVNGNKIITCANKTESRYLAEVSKIWQSEPVHVAPGDDGKVYCRYFEIEDGSSGRFKTYGCSSSYGPPNVCDGVANRSLSMRDAFNFSIILKNASVSGTTFIPTNTNQNGTYNKTSSANALESFGNIAVAAFVALVVA